MYGGSRATSRGWANERYLILGGGPGRGNVLATSLPVFIPKITVFYQKSPKKVLILIHILIQNHQPGATFCTSTNTYINTNMY
jgi:hypothetical protein